MGMVFLCLKQMFSQTAVLSHRKAAETSEPPARGGKQERPEVRQCQVRAGAPPPGLSPLRALFPLKGREDAEGYKHQPCLSCAPHRALVLLQIPERAGILQEAPDSPLDRTRLWRPVPPPPSPRAVHFPSQHPSEVRPLGLLPPPALTESSPLRVG